jgi:hypothetical protein
MSGTLSVWMQFVGVVKSKSMGDGPTFMAETGSLTATGEVDARLREMIGFAAHFVWKA